MRLLADAQVSMVNPSTHTCILFIVVWARKCILDILARDRKDARSHTRQICNDPLMSDSLETRSAMLISRLLLAECPAPAENRRNCCPSLKTC